MEIIFPRLFRIRAVRPRPVGLLIVDDVSCGSFGKFKQFRFTGQVANTRKHLCRQQTRVENPRVALRRITETNLARRLNTPRQVFQYKITNIPRCFQIFIL
jgi:hypothetical protein